MRHFGARVTDLFRLDELRTVTLENELLELRTLRDFYRAGQGTGWPFSD